MITCGSQANHIFSEKLNDEAFVPGSYRYTRSINMDMHNMHRSLFAVLCYESLWHPVTETTLYIQSQCIRKAFFFPHGIGQGHEPTLSKVDDRRANVSHHVRALHDIVWSSDFSHDSAEVDLDASLGN